MSMRRPLVNGWLLVLALALSGGVATPVQAQDAAQNAASDIERLTRFARAHAAINDARDDFHGQVARVHDEEGRRRAREEVDARIAAILEEEQIPREEYDAFILRISLDGELRARFEEILDSISEESPT